jgi:catechol 2,3-dioxygenase-like lactoylglutathione lyase family enzyme
MAKPQARGIYHVGITVVDIERSIAFYRDVVGLELAWRQESDTPYIAQLTGLPGTHLLVAYMKPSGVDGPLIELLQYLAPMGTPVDTTPCNPGNAHVCFFVEDLDATYRELSEQGVHFVSPPVHIAAGVHQGSSTVYAKDPDGITLEFFQR